MAKKRIRWLKKRKWDIIEDSIEHIAWWYTINQLKHIIQHGTLKERKALWKNKEKNN